MMTIARSLALYYAETLWGNFRLDSSYSKIGNEYMAGHSHLLFFSGVSSSELRRTGENGIGRHILCGWREYAAARLRRSPCSNNDSCLISFAGLTAAIGAVIETSRLNSISTSSSGNMYELDAITANHRWDQPFRRAGSHRRHLVRGTYPRSISNIMNLLNISPYLQGVVKGLIIIAAVLLTETRLIENLSRY